METLAAGQRLDRYALMRCLGRGAFSTAFAAIDTRTNSPGVLKCANLVILGNATAIDRSANCSSVMRTLA